MKAAATYLLNLTFYVVHNITRSAKQKCYLAQKPAFHKKEQSSDMRLGNSSSSASELKAVNHPANSGGLQELKLNYNF